MLVSEAGGLSVVRGGCLGERSQGGALHAVARAGAGAGGLVGLWKGPREEGGAWVCTCAYVCKARGAEPAEAGQVAIWDLCREGVAHGWRAGREVWTPATRWLCPGISA